MALSLADQDSATVVERDQKNDQEKCGTGRGRGEAKRGSRASKWGLCEQQQQDAGKASVCTRGCLANLDYSTMSVSLTSQATIQQYSTSPRASRRSALLLLRHPMRLLRVLRRHPQRRLLKRLYLIPCGFSCARPCDRAPSSLARYVGTDNSRLRRRQSTWHR